MARRGGGAGGGRGGGGGGVSCVWRVGLAGRWRRAGEGGRTKGPGMGRAAGEGSDLVVMTSDNPRSEEPGAIIEEALVGVEETGADCIVEQDRAGAIAIAIRAAKAGDIVLLAGKGHEKVQILRDGSVPFDDVAVAASV